MLVKTSCRLSRSIVYTAADAVGSYLCDSDKVVVELSFQDEKEIASQAGLGFSPSPLDFATLPWLQPARLALLVQIQWREAFRRYQVQESEFKSLKADDRQLQDMVDRATEDNIRLAQKVERLEKLLDLAAPRKANDRLGMEEFGTLQHQISVPGVAHRLITKNFLCAGLTLATDEQNVKQVLQSSSTEIGKYNIGLDAKTRSVETLAPLEGSAKRRPSSVTRPTTCTPPMLNQAPSVQADEMEQAGCGQKGGQSQAGLIKALHPTPHQAAETSDMGEADTTLLEEDVSLHSEQDPADGSRQNDNSVDAEVLNMGASHSALPEDHRSLNNYEMAGGSQMESSLNVGSTDSHDSNGVPASGPANSDGVPASGPCAAGGSMSPPQAQAPPAQLAPVVKPYNNVEPGPAPKYDPGQDEAPAFFAQLPFRLTPLPPAPAPPCLSERRVQEVVTHLQSCLPERPQVERSKETILTRLGVDVCNGVDPNAVFIRGLIIGRGGNGFVRLARYDATWYNCVLKTITHWEGGASVEELAERECDRMRQAWDGGVSHTVQPLGLYYASQNQPPQAFILMRLAEGAVGSALGKQLHRRLPSGVKLLPEQVEWVVLRCTKSMLQGLLELEQADLAIADVKPANLFLDPSKLQDGAGPLVQLIDYGTATNGPNLISACQPHACCTRSSFTVLHLDAAAGSAKHTTPRYMAPEMHDAYARDLPRAALTHHQGLADIYSVDICTWRLLAGRDVFRRALRHKNQLHVTRDNDQRQILRLYLKSELAAHLNDPTERFAVGYYFEADMDAYSEGLRELVVSMLQPVFLRKSAGALLQMPILAQLPDQ
ncbi:hypothetical protein ABBQ32_008426 [Trebouxia sp. C0010 RCD-2024]